MVITLTWSPGLKLFPAKPKLIMFDGATNLTTLPSPFTSIFRNTWGLIQRHSVSGALQSELFVFGTAHFRDAWPAERKRANEAGKYQETSDSLVSHATPQCRVIFSNPEFQFPTLPRSIRCCMTSAHPFCDLTQIPRNRRGIRFRAYPLQTIPFGRSQFANFTIVLRVSVEFPVTTAGPPLKKCQAEYCSM